MILSLIIFLPLIGALAVAVLPRESPARRWVAVGASLATLAASLVMFVGFSPALPGFQFVESYLWIPAYNIGYKLGVDGISLWLILLTNLVFPLAIGYSFSTIKTREREYYSLFLLMQTATLGVFLSLDLFLFYVFWEFALVPMYFIIGIWGGDRRIYASLKFFVYTMLGSVLMLLGILYIGYTGGTFDLEALMKANLWAASAPLFLAFALAFAIKVPLWPFHSWLPDAHVEAPTAGSVVLAAILLKMGTYGLLRFNLGLFSEASKQFAPLMMTLAVIGILYGAVVAFAQSDAKKLVAYSSVSHMGYIVLGIFALNGMGAQGALLQMINHGLSTGGLFLVIGFIYERLHTRDMGKMGGLWAKMPLYGTLALLLVLSSVGLPGLNGFVGEYVILQGAFQANQIATAFAAVGMVLSAVYLLTMFQKIFLGKARDEAGEGARAAGHTDAGHAAVAGPGGISLADLNWREVLAVAPLIVLCFVIGLMPTPFFDVMKASIGRIFAMAVAGVAP